MSGSVRSAVRHAGHLARRFAGSLSRRPPAPDDVTWAQSLLRAGEGELWDSMPVEDRRHSLLVARRFAERRPTAGRAEMAGALLHDVGKVAAGLGTRGRVVATVVGPRTVRFRRYHDHERLGAEMAARVGSDPLTVAMVGRERLADRELARALEWADDI